MKNSNWELLESKLEQPIQAPRAFGRLQWWRDESPHSLVSAVAVTALLTLLLLIPQFVVTPNDQGKPGSPEVTVEQYKKGNSQGVGTDPVEVADAIQQATVSNTTARPVDVIDQLDATQPSGQVPTHVVRPATDLTKLTDVKNSSAQLADTFKALEANRVQRRSQQGGRVQIRGFAGLSGLFNVASDVKSIVYVVDKSSSMAGLPLESVKAELMHGIDSLKEDQSFGVVFFDDFAWPQFVDRGSVVTAQINQTFKLLPATAANRQRATEWISRIPGTGSTNPVPAMSLAIGEKPALILLLSDGEFAPSAVTAITQMNHRLRGSTGRIDCVGLAEDIDTLQDIATQNSGKYYARPAGP